LFLINLMSRVQVFTELINAGVLSFESQNLFSGYHIPPLVSEIILFQFETIAVKLPT
jgi:hypothetical protein